MMTRSWLLAACLVLAACDGGTQLDDTAADTDTDAAEGSELVGDWVSEGADVAGTLAGPPGFVVRVDATFGADGAYAVDAEDNQGTVTSFAGTYTVDTSTTPHGITITQSSPYQATVRGIWQVTDGVLSYDVIQTDPDLGVAPATPAGGFGSSALGTANVQTYRAP